MMDAYLEIGKILKPQGLQGEVKVQPVTDNPSRFLSLAYVYMKSGSAYKKVAVRSVSVREGLAYLSLEGVTDRAVAEKLRDELLYIDRAHAVKADPDAVFIADLIGCRVLDENGVDVGVIRDVLQLGANDVYEIATPRGMLWLPALRDVATNIDVASEHITVDSKRMAETAVCENGGDD